VSRSLPDPESLPDQVSACSAPSGTTYGTVPEHPPQAACPRISSGRRPVIHHLGDHSGQASGQVGGEAR
jgi:hypothetical protein